MTTQRFSRAVSLSLFLLPLALGFPAACTVDNPAETSIGGTVSGLASRGELVLDLNGAETLTIVDDGQFAFDTLLRDSEIFRVTIAEQPDRAECEIAGDVGRAEGLGVDSIEVTCIGTDSTLLSLDVSTIKSFDQAFEAERFEYDLSLSLLSQRLQFVAVASDAEAVIEVEGVEVASGESSPEFALGLGDTLFKVSVAAPSGTSSTYFVTAKRGDAVIVQGAYAKAPSPSTEDFFGTSLAVSEDTLVVGAPFEDSGIDGTYVSDSGSVFVFRRIGATWIQEAHLKASNAEHNDHFGGSVALSGNTLVVGANAEDSQAMGVDRDESNNDVSNSGAAYVFHREGDTWSQQAYLKASNTGIDAQFGTSVSVHGDLIVVGASREASGGQGVNASQFGNDAPNSGAAYVFHRDGGNWSQEAYLKASNAGGNDSFGFAISLHEDTLVVGAIAESSSATGVNSSIDDNARELSGAVYVFRRESGAWSEEAYLKASNTGSGDLFGVSVAVHVDTIVVGAAHEDGIAGVQTDNSVEQSGAAYVFHRTGSTWIQEAYLKASNSSADFYFGFSVATHNDTVIVGAPGELSNATGIDGSQNNSGLTQSGAVYVYHRDSGVLSQVSYVKASNTGQTDTFGRSVALSGELLYCGAPGEASNDGGLDGDQTNNDKFQSGAVYMFH